MNSQQDQSRGKSESGTPNRAQQPANQASQESKRSSEQGSQSPSLSDAIRSQAQPAQASAQPKRENLGTEQVSGLNGLDTPSQARGLAGIIDSHNRQTGAAGSAAQGASQSNSRAGQRQGASAGQSQSEVAPAWQQTLKTGWQTVSERVRGASPAQLALGAAAIGAAVWLGTRKRSSSPSAGSQQQSASDRWGQPDQSRFGQASNETWQRPTSERWDD